MLQSLLISTWFRTSDSCYLFLLKKPYLQLNYRPAISRLAYFLQTQVNYTPLTEEWLKCLIQQNFQLHPINLQDQNGYKLPIPQIIQTSSNNLSTNRSRSYWSTNYHIFQQQKIRSQLYLNLSTRHCYIKAQIDYVHHLFLVFSFR